MTDISKINSQVRSVFNNSNFDAVKDVASKVSSAAALSRQTELKEAGQVIDGFKAVTDSKVGEAIAEFTGAIPGLEDDLIGDVSSAVSDLDSITGGSSSNGALDVCIGSASPAAISKAVEGVTGKAPSSVKALKNLAPAGIRDAVGDIDNILSNGAASAVGFSEQLNKFKGAFDLNLGKFSSSLLGNVMVALNVGILDLLDDVADFAKGNITKEEIIDLLISGKTDEALRELELIAKIPIDELTSKVKAVPLDPSKATDNSTSTAIGEKTTECYIIGSNETEWKGASTPLTRNTNVNGGSYVFTYVGSKEELVAEFRNTPREITEFVAHWTATYTNQDIGAEEVHRWHLDKGWDGCGYHYVIRRDGTLQRGRPVGRKGAHSGAYGHNNYSIGITFVGGYNCPSGTNNPNRFISADSLTNEQMKTFEMFCDAFYNVWPAGQAYGHIDTSDKGKIDPGFDVQQFVLNKFGKTNVNKIAKNVSPLSPTELAAKAIA